HQAATSVDADVDAALEGDRGLGNQQTGQRSIAHPSDDPAVDGVVALFDRGDEPAGLLDLRKHEEAVDGVHSVGVFVRLGAQGAHHQREPVDLTACAVEQVCGANRNG